MRQLAILALLLAVTSATAGDIFSDPDKITGPSQVHVCSGLVQLLADKSAGVSASGWTITSPRLQFMQRSNEDKSGIIFAAPGYPCTVNVSYVEVLNGAIVFYQHDVQVLPGGPVPPPSPPPTPPVDPPTNPPPTPPGDRLAALTQHVAAAVRQVDKRYIAVAPKIAANLYSIVTMIRDKKLATPEDAIRRARSLNRMSYSSLAERHAWDAVFRVVDNRLIELGYDEFSTVGEIAAPLAAVARGIQTGAK